MLVEWSHGAEVLGLGLRSGRSSFLGVIAYHIGSGYRRAGSHDFDYLGTVLVIARVPALLTFADRGERALEARDT